MKKERNAFFQNQSASSYFYPTGNAAMNMGSMQNYGGYPMATESSSNFYQGPIIAPMPSQTNDYSSEIETRLAKIERQLNRLDMRISKLESEITNPLGNASDYSTNSNMYMV